MKSKTDQKPSSALAQRVRIDKWLWAARFFKTRSLAKTAIEGGKVHCNGDRCKSSRELEVGAMLRIRQGYNEVTVKVIGVSDQRRGAPEAALLYEETAESIATRTLEAEQRKALNASMNTHTGRPTKQDRRKIHQFKQEMQDS